MSRREDAVSIPRDHQDLRTYVRRLHLRIWLKTLLWEGAWIAIFLYYRGREDMSFDYRFSLVLSILLLVGLFLFGWVRSLFDRNYRGRISSIKTKQVMMVDTATRKRRLAQQMILAIEEENGRRHKITLPFKESYDRYYHMDDRITHYRGLPYPESNDGADKDLYLCLLCGGMETTDTDHCHGCGMSLIKPYRSRYRQSRTRI